MSLPLEWALAGWGCAAAALAALGLARARIGVRMALVAEASHELRGPLTAVQLGLASLGLDAEPERAGRAAALDLELRRAGLALADLAAAPEGRRSPDQARVVHVGELLEQTGHAWTGVAAGLGSRLEVERPAEGWVVRGDRIRLAQALGNLIVNALEHGEAPVRIRARPAAGGRLRLEVADAGPGLGEALGAVRPHARRRGHGLAVAARVARRCGGRLVSERSGAEHVIAVELPLALPLPAASGRAA